MKIDFDFIEEKVLTNVRGGDGDVSIRLGGDEQCKIQKMVLKKGCSVGYHPHEGSCEIIYILSGIATFLDDGETYQLTSGKCQYCPEHHEHSIRNDQEEDLIFLAVIPTL